MEITKSGMITIAGRPNAGKSTLINALVGEKIAIVSDKPQTTRNRICGVFNRGNAQFVFVDTPGFHKPRSRLGDFMMKVVKESVANVDAVVMVVEPVDHVGTPDQLLMERLRQTELPTILAINKIDTIKKEDILAIIATYQNAFDFDAYIPISAKTGDGLEALIEEMGKYVCEGPQLFPDGMTSDQPEKQIIAEIVREKLLLNLEREVPHGTAVEVTRFTERDNEIIDVEITIFCEKESHKGIIIGKKGTMLKKIGEQARLDIEVFMGTKVYLTTWVKVKENWRDNQTQMRNFGFDS